MRLLRCYLGTVTGENDVTSSLVQWSSPPSFTVISEKLIQTSGGHITETTNTFFLSAPHVSVCWSRSVFSTRSHCSLCSPSESLKRWDKSQWCAVVSPPPPALSPPVRPGCWLNYLAAPPPPLLALTPLFLCEQEAKLFIGGERRWGSVGPPTERRSLVSTLVLIVLNRAQLPGVPDMFCQMVQGTEVLCSQCLPATHWALRSSLCYAHTRHEVQCKG